MWVQGAPERAFLGLRGPSCRCRRMRRSEREEAGGEGRGERGEGPGQDAWGGRKKRSRRDPCAGQKPRGACKGRRDRTVGRVLARTRVQSPAPQR